MEKIPQSRYTKEFREEATRLVIENGMSVGEVSARLSLPKPTLERDCRLCHGGSHDEEPGQRVSFSCGCGKTAAPGLIHHSVREGKYCALEVR